MTDTYATVEDLAARLSSQYLPVSDAEQQLVKASELIDFATQGRAQVAWDGGDAADKAAITAATCDQVEFWLEVGEEYDVLGVTGAIQAGRLQISRPPGVLGQRALRTLLRAGLYWAGAPST